MRTQARRVIPPEPIEYFLPRYSSIPTHIGGGTSTPINGTTQRVPEELLVEGLGNGVECFGI